jgi:hypothetical protein
MGPSFGGLTTVAEEANCNQQAWRGKLFATVAGRRAAAYAAVPLTCFPKLPYIATLLTGGKQLDKTVQFNLPFCLVTPSVE